MDAFHLLLALHAPLPGRDLAAELRAEGLDPEISRNLADTWAAVRDRPPRAVLLSPVHEDGDSAELLSLLRPADGSRVPPTLLVLTDRPEFLDVRAADIDGFVAPDEPAPRLARRIRHAVARHEARQALAEERESLLRASSTDFKTGLANDRRFAEACRIEHARAIRENHWLGVVMIDLDEFKSINDDHDHLFGDHVLKELADTLRAGLRPFDTPARKGGDEFAVLLPSADLDASRAIAERLRAAFAERELRHGGHRRRATITLGVAAWHPEGETEFEDVLLAADQALLAAKEAGRNRVFASERGGEPAAAPPKAADEPTPGARKASRGGARKKKARKATTRKKTGGS